MPPLEDAMVKSECREFYTAEALLPVEIKIKIGQNLPHIDQSTVAPPQVADLSTNTPSRQNATNIDSQQQTTNMVSHSNVSKPDTKISNTMSRLRQRIRLRKLVRRREQTSNNNNGEHTLLDQNIVTPTNVVTEPIPKVDFTPSTSVIGAHPTEPAQTKAPAGETLQHNSQSINQLKNATTRPHSPYQNEDIKSKVPNDGET